MNPENTDVSAIGIEVAQCTRYSRDVFEVIGKKLLKRYRRGRSLWCLSKGRHACPSGKIHDFIGENNLQNRQVFIVGAGETPGSFKLVTCHEVPQPGTGEMAIVDAEFDAELASKGYFGMRGWSTDSP